MLSDTSHQLVIPYRVAFGARQEPLLLSLRLVHAIEAASASRLQPVSAHTGNNVKQRCMHVSSLDSIDHYCGRRV
jgi:hypothetical protein